MAARTYRVGIVGAGEHVAYSSEVHSLRDDPSIPVRNTVVAGHAASLALMPNVEVIGICDLDPELKFTARLGDENNAKLIKIGIGIQLGISERRRLTDP